MPLTLLDPCNDPFGMHIVLDLHFSQYVRKSLVKIVEKSTAQKDRATGKNDQRQKLELGTYTLLQSFSHKLLVPVKILCAPNRPLVPFMGV